MSIYVYVNGEAVELLDDYRLALYPRYPEGTQLFDATVFPPQEVPLSTDLDEAGVTSRKLLPFGTYFAYCVHALTGELVAARVEQCVLIVHGLPANTTAEMLGKFFEDLTHAYITEANVFKGETITGDYGGCTGRGFVAFREHAAVHELLTRDVRYRYITFPDGQGNFVPVVLEWTNRIPRVSPPPHYKPLVSTQPSHPATIGGAPVPAASVEQHMDPRSALPAGAVNGHGMASWAADEPPTKYFVTQIYEQHLSKSVEEGIFWPSKQLQKTVYTALETHRVVLFFVIHGTSTIVGYANLRPREFPKGSKGTSFHVRWIRHSLRIACDELGHDAPPQEDGAVVYPDLGERLCARLDRERMVGDGSKLVAQPNPSNTVRTDVPIGRPPHNHHSHHHHSSHPHNNPHSSNYHTHHSTSHTHSSQHSHHHHHHHHHNHHHGSSHHHASHTNHLHHHQHVQPMSRGMAPPIPRSSRVNPPTA